MNHLMRAANLWGYDELVGKLGGDPARLLARFHIPAKAQRPDDLFLHFRDIALLLETTAAELDCPDFGLQLAQWQGLQMLGPIAVIARNADTIGAAFTAIARYLHIHSPSLQLQMSQPCVDRLKADYRITELLLPQKRQAYELSMANGIQILRLLAGEQISATQMSFMHPAVSSTATYAAAFGCEVKFEQDWCGFYLPLDLASKPIDSADAQTLQLITAYLESAYAPGTASIATQVSELIRRLLPTGQCNANTIAEHLRLHPRTLQRQLAEEGTRYDYLLDQERQEQARKYLSETTLRLSQITGLLGYAEQSAFNRAFRRWFGTTPRKYKLATEAKER